MVKRQMQREGMVEIFGKEIVVFKQKKNTKIACDADQKQSETQCFFAAVQHLLREQIIDYNASGNNGDIARMIISVKDKGGQDQKDLIARIFFRKTAEKKIDDQSQRKKGQNEDI